MIILNKLKKMKAKLVKTKSNYVLSIDEKFINLFNYAIDSKDYGWVVAESFGGELLKLSKENCDEIFGVVDVEKLVEYEYPTINLGVNITTDIHVICQEPFINGFNKAMELNKDRMFTLKDMVKARNRGDWYSDEDWESYIQSLQQPTKIDVDIVMEDHFEKTSEIYVDEVGIGNYFNHSKKPKLDENNCLILKPIK
jgi:hypothetical protein